MTPNRLHAAVTWLGPISTREAATALRCTQRTVLRLMVGQPLGRDAEGRIAIGAPRRPDRPCVLAVAALLDGDPIYSDWLSEQTGYSRRAVYAALRELGYTVRRGRGAMWVRMEMAGK